MAGAQLGFVQHPLVAELDQDEIRVRPDREGPLTPEPEAPGSGAGEALREPGQ